MGLDSSVNTAVITIIAYWFCAFVTFVLISTPLKKAQNPGDFSLFSDVILALLWPLYWFIAIIRKVL